MGVWWKRAKPARRELESVLWRNRWIRRFIQTSPSQHISYGPTKPTNSNWDFWLDFSHGFENTEAGTSKSCVPRNSIRQWNPKNCCCHSASLSMMVWTRKDILAQLSTISPYTMNLRINLWISSGLSYQKEAFLPSRKHLVHFVHTLSLLPVISLAVETHCHRALAILHGRCPSFWTIWNCYNFCHLVSFPKRLLQYQNISQHGLRFGIVIIQLRYMSL